MTDIRISRQEYQIVIIFYTFKKLGRHMEDIKKRTKTKTKLLFKRKQSWRSNTSTDYMTS